MTWLVAGLGNPDDHYADTRHNLGAMVVEELASRAGERFRKQRFVPVDAAEIRVGDERVLLVRSHRYMNESGPSYASLAAKQDVPSERVICVHDEVDLALGALQVRIGGGAAGHNGVKSLIGGLGTPEFPRVRCGIGRPPGRQDTADFVLEPFGARERDLVIELVDDAADAVLSLVGEGLARTQDRYNRSGPRA
ncbi:MAG: aminoacyl-tRNA hydrolase [Actinomycetota bacterium]